MTKAQIKDCHVRLFDVVCSLPRHRADSNCGGFLVAALTTSFPLETENHFSCRDDFHYHVRRSELVFTFEP